MNKKHSLNLKYQLWTLLLCCLSTGLFAQSKVALDSSMVINVTAAGDGNLLIDEQTTAGDPENSSGGSPSNSYLIGWDNTDYPATVVLDLKQDFDLTNLWFYDINGNDSLHIYKGDTTNWELVASLTTNSYNSWRSQAINDTTRFLKFVFKTRGANIAEVVLYGTGLGNFDPPDTTSNDTLVKRIFLNDTIVINTMAIGELENLWDEQDSVGDPRNGLGGMPVTRFGPMWDSIIEPYIVMIDLQTDHELLELYAYDNSANSDTVYVYTGDPGNWTRVNDLISDQTGTWIKLTIPDTTRFIRLDFHAHEELEELALYGHDLGTSATPAPGSADVNSNPPPDFGNVFMGTNGFFDEPDSLLEVMGSHRQYTLWQWLEPYGDDTTYTGYPNNAFKMNHHNVDEKYASYKSNGIRIVPVIQQTADHISDGRDANTKPIARTADPLDPNSYVAHADMLFQFAARYGRTSVADSLLKLDSNTIRSTGLDYFNWLENWNEQDKDWANSYSYFDPFEMAAMSSADYDGHEGAMGSTVGIKNADSTMKMAIGGLAFLDVDYIRGMKLWSDYNRTTGFPGDAINFHHYSNDYGEQRGHGTVGVSPEEDDLKGRLKAVVEYRNKWLPGVEVWISEFGYSTHPNSRQRAPKIGPHDEEEMQGRWLIRSFLEISAAGVDRAFQYLLSDYKTEYDSPFSADGLVSDRWGKTDPIYIWEDGVIIDTTFHEHDSYEKKKSWYYMGGMKHALDGFYFHQELNSGNPDVNLYEFRNAEEDATVYAVWCNTSDNTVINNFEFNVTSNAYRCVTLTPDSTNRFGSLDTLVLNGDSVGLTVSELPVFVLKTHNDSVGPTAVAQDLTVYLDASGSATIQALDVDGGSTDNKGIVSRSISQSSFGCSDVGAATAVVVVSDTTWESSSEVNTTTAGSFPWSGVSGNLPADSTYTTNAIAGQPYSWHSVDAVSGSQVLKAGNWVTFHRKQFQLSNPMGTVRLQTTGDDDIEVYINGTLIAREDIFGVSSHATLPAHDVFFDGSSTNGYDSGDSYDFVTTTALSQVLVSGTNTMVIAVRNGAPGSGGSSGNVGAFSCKLTIESTGIPVTLTVSDHVNNQDSAVAVVTVLDTLAPIALANDYTLVLDANGQGMLDPLDIDNGSFDNCNTIVDYQLSDTLFDCADITGRSSISTPSDTTWLRSTVALGHNFPWPGITANDIPHDSTFTLAAEEGQTVGWELVKAVTGAQAIKSFSDVNVFKKTFTLPGNQNFEAHLQMTGDDFIQVLINGTSIGLSGNATANSSLPAHQLFYDRDGTVTNGYNSGDAFDSYYNSSLDGVLHSGTNEVVVAVRNSATATGGFSFNMTLSAEGAFPVTLTVEDSKGETASASALVTIEDQTAPTVVAKDISVTLDGSGMASITAQDVDSSSTDGCGIASLTVTPSDFTCNDEGANVVTLTVTDSSGNSSIAYPTVTVDTAAANCQTAKMGGKAEGSDVSDEAGLVSEIQVYPNPVRGELTVTSTDAIQQIQLLDMHGKVVVDQRVNGTAYNLDLSELPVGIYTLRTTQLNGTAHFKVVKQ